MSRSIEQSVQFYKPIDERSMWINFMEGSELGFPAEKYGKGGNGRVRSLHTKPYKYSRLYRRKITLNARVGEPPRDYYQLIGSKNVIHCAIKILQAAHYIQQEDLY